MNTFRFLFITATLHTAFLLSARADYHLWKGGAAYAYWSDDDNWAIGGCPAPGESGFVELGFGQSAVDFSPVSDVDNLPVDKIEFAGPNSYLIATRTGGPIILKPQASGDSIASSCPEVKFHYPLVLTNVHQIYCNAGTHFFLNNATVGVGGFIFRGTGTTHVAGSESNWFAGGITFPQGILKLEKETGPAFGGNLTIGKPGSAENAFVYVNQPDQIPDVSAITMHANGSLFVSDVDETIGPLTMTGGQVYGGNGGVGGNSRLILGGNVTVLPTATETPTMSGDISIGSVDREFNVPTESSLTIYADLSSSAPNAGLVKKGGGVLSLYGDNVFTGATDVRDGRLRVTHDNHFSPVTVRAGAELLAFNTRLGSVTGTNGKFHVTYLAAATFAVETAAVDLSGNSTFRTDLHGPNNGTQYGQLMVHGTVTLNGCALDVVPSYNVPVGQQFVIIDNDGVDPVNGTFQNLPEGGRAIFGDGSWQITYHGGTGNDVVLTRKADSARLNTIFRFASGAIFITGQGEANKTYRKEATDDLITWTDIGPVTANGAGALQFIDVDATSHPRRFYRCPVQ